MSTTLREPRYHIKVDFTKGIKNELKIMRRSKKPFIRFVLSFLLWIALLILVFGFSPTGYLIPIFFLLLFLALYFLLSSFLPLASPITIGIVGYLVLRFFHMDNNLNLVLLLSLVVSLGLYQNKG